MNGEGETHIKGVEALLSPTLQTLVGRPAGPERDSLNLSSLQRVPACASHTRAYSAQSASAAVWKVARPRAGAASCRQGSRAGVENSSDQQHSLCMVVFTQTVYSKTKCDWQGDLKQLTLSPCQYFLGHITCVVKHAPVYLQPWA
jgi:hypothetical protein